MITGQKKTMPKQKSDINSRNSLIIKIALFLNYLSKDNHNKLLRDIQKFENNAGMDVLKLMLVKKYVRQQDISDLKKTCLSFARAQEDTRFGSLCLSFGFLTQSNLGLALDEQKNLTSNGNSIMLGDLLVDAGMISTRQRNLILQKQKLENIGRNNSPVKNGPSTVIKNSIEDPPFEKNNVREIREPEIIFLIQNDALKVFAMKTDEFDNKMMLADLKFLLEKNGIIYGLTDDDSLESFIKEEKYLESYFEFAKGLEPIDGTDAQIVYMFERDYLKAGNLAKDGTMDFKDRGDIPFVSQGDILAEKIPPKDGKDGISIYGDVIPKSEAMDISFNVGKNASVSRDGLRVISESDGNPKFKQDGEISVNDAYFIDGDVDYTTGHIKFDKNVYITGSIKSGFRVEAIDVVANTIDGGIVKAEGDVFIQNGVTESDIQAKGSIRAGFMHRSKASCMGDMSIAKEIADTEVLLEGTFEMNKGRVFSSAICAKGGAKIYNIGSEKAKPSTITVGTSIYLETQLQQIDEVIDRRQNILESKGLEKSKIEKEIATIDEKLDDFDQSRKRTISMIKEMESNAKEDHGSKVDLFQKSLDEADKKIHDLKDRKALLETRQRKAGKDIISCAGAVKLSVKEKFTLKRLNQANPPKPILDVAGKVLSGTRISGRYAKLILNQNLTRSRIMEINSTSEDGIKRGWEMIVASL